MQQGSEQWLEWRRNGIGASEVAAILGVCKYSTPYQVWREKTGRGRSFAGNFATQKGTELEGAARARYELFNMEDMPPAIAVHPKYEICRASLDGIRADGKLILEIKCPGRESHETACANLVPDHYIPQCQFQLAVTGADELHYFSYYDKDQTSALVVVKPDLDYQAMLVAKALNFWKEHIVSDIAPSLTEMDVKIVDDPEVVSICAKLIDQRDLLSKEKLDEMKRQVIQLGGHSKVRCGRVLVTCYKAAEGKPVLRMTITKEEAQNVV